MATDGKAMQSIPPTAVSAHRTPAAGKRQPRHWTFVWAARAVRANCVYGPPEGQDRRTQTRNLLTPAKVV